MAEKDLQIAVVHIISIFRNPRYNKPFQGFLQAEAVYIHLHVVWDLVRFQAGTLQLTGFNFLFLNIGIKLQFLTAFMQETERS